MSGTSLDGIDAVLVSFDDTDHSIELLAKEKRDFPRELHADIKTIIAGWDDLESELIEPTDLRLGELYADAVQSLLQTAGIGAKEVTAIGCHGQTVSHQPDATPPFTLQLGHGPTLAQRTGITVINDFRSADMALGGQGAPLVPAFHEWAFADEDVIAAVNIGGIANISVINPDKPVSGYDTGPGNTLLDYWINRHRGEDFDREGAWARAGNVNPAWLDTLLADSYFSRQPPKSTGREYFNPDWLSGLLPDADTAPADAQATLAELTAITIGDAVKRCGARKVFLCGGGAANLLLVERIDAPLGDIPVATTDAVGVPPDWVEAIAFAWLARERLAGRPAGRPSVTGASAAALLGTIHPSPET
jgi:anhydro-N-acetylmuramic acid kinase